LSKTRSSRGGDTSTELSADESENKKQTAAIDISPAESTYVYFVMHMQLAYFVIEAVYLHLSPVCGVLPAGPITTWIINIMLH